MYFFPQDEVSTSFLRFYSFTDSNLMILQHPRIIVGYAGFKPETSTPKIWCANNEPPHLFVLSARNFLSVGSNKKRATLAPTNSRFSTFFHAYSVQDSSTRQVMLIIWRGSEFSPNARRDESGGVALPWSLLVGNVICPKLTMFSLYLLVSDVFLSWT